LNFDKGEQVHHPIHGIGKVQSIRKRSFSGEKETTFAQVYFQREGLTLMLREKDLAKTVRKPINANEARQLLDHLEGWNGDVRKEWKARASANQVAMEGGDPFACADVYKGLSKLEAAGTMRATDREHLKKSLALLVEELSCALGETLDQARDKIAGL
jgi:RNA polymerase-interacting CarD/CdnL/TRCF family regulator